MGVGALIDLVLPVECAGCGVAGVAWCAECARELTAPRPVSRPVLAGGPPAYALGRYRGAARAAVLAYKERGRRDLAGALARPLARALPELPGAAPDRAGTWWLVPAPSRRVAARVRGGEHVRRLAREMAGALARSGIRAAVAPCLRLRDGARDSVGLSADDRVTNLTGRVAARRAAVPPWGTPVVLLDDVITTGATLSRCAGVLRWLGAEPVAALALVEAGATTPNARHSFR